MITYPSRTWQERRVCGTPPLGMVKAGAFARAWGITRQVLYTYGLMGILAADSTSPGGQKWYGTAAAQRMATIRLMQGEGKTLAEIRDAVECNSIPALPVV